MATFELDCPTRPYSTVIEGDADVVSDRIEDHRADVRGDPGDHFVVAWCLA